MFDAQVKSYSSITYRFLLLLQEIIDKWLYKNTLFLQSVQQKSHSSLPKGNIFITVSPGGEIMIGVIFLNAFFYGQHLS